MEGEKVKRERERGREGGYSAWVKINEIGWVALFRLGGNLINNI